jgi:hypothetical protein
VAGLSTRAVAHASVPEDVGADLDLWVDPELSGPAVGSGHRPRPAASGHAARDGASGRAARGNGVRQAAPDSDRSANNGLAVLRSAALAETVRRASEHATGRIGSERLLPVLPELRDLLPGPGLRRGATIAVITGAGRSAAGRSADEAVGSSADGLSIASSAGATSLMFALLAAASGAGSWCAVVGVPTLGALAAAEAGIALERLALVPNPGPDWTTVVAALLDGCDIVVAAPPGPIAPSVANRLSARARQRGTVFVSFGRWAGADITFDATGGDWHGLGEGRGRLRSRQLTVVAHGRGASAAPRRTEVTMPKPAGLLEMSDPVDPFLTPDEKSAAGLAASERSAAGLAPSERSESAAPSGAARRADEVAARIAAKTAHGADSRSELLAEEQSELLADSQHELLAG